MVWYTYLEKSEIAAAAIGVGNYAFGVAVALSHYYAHP